MWDNGVLMRAAFVTPLVYGLFTAVLVAGCGGEVPVDEEPTVPPLVAIDGIAEFEDINPDPHILEVNLFAHYNEVALASGGKTWIMAYNGTTPGPLLHARVGDRVIVHFYNQLAEPTTVHWHGLRISDEMDGNPRIMNPVLPGESFVYDFVLPDAGTYWYHPHVNTVEQIGRGLHGMIVVEEAVEDAPVFNQERVLALTDIRLDNNNQIAPFKNYGPDLMHGRYGNTLLTNGKSATLKATVKRGAVERWRLVNAAQARHMSLSVEGASWRIVGVDGGLLPQPYATERMSLTVGQRFDLEVVFDGEPGSKVTLTQHVFASVNGEVQEVPVVVAEYTIGEDINEPATPVYPAVELPPLPADAEELLFSLGAVNKPGTGVVFTINGKSFPNIPDAVVQQNVPRLIRVKNEIGPYHPFHLHGQFFQILTRDGAPANEPGLRDTVFVGGQQEVTLLSHFTNPGAWMSHCHIAGHAEKGMMSHVIVEAATP